MQKLNKDDREKDVYYFLFCIDTSHGYMDEFFDAENPKKNNL
jgi:hypothetical protein